MTGSLWSFSIPRTAPRLTDEYFQAAASVYAAARDCVRRGLPLSRLYEIFRSPANALTAPELMRLLMDDCGFSMADAYQTTARCCGNLRSAGLDVERVWLLQPRTAHVVSLLRGLCSSTLALEHDGALRNSASRLRRPHGGTGDAVFPHPGAGRVDKSLGSCPGG